MQKPFIFPFNKIALGVEIKMTATNYLLAVISSSVGPHFLQLVLLTVSQMSNVELSSLQWSNCLNPLQVVCLLSVKVYFSYWPVGTFGNSNILDSYVSTSSRTLISSHLSPKCPREATRRLQLPHLSHLVK